MVLSFSKVCSSNHALLCIPSDKENHNHAIKLLFIKFYLVFPIMDNFIQEPLHIYIQPIV